MTCSSAILRMPRHVVKKKSSADGYEHVGKTTSHGWKLGAYGGASGLGITLFAHGAQKLLDWLAVTASAPQ
jgi:hypothetical protein